MKLTLIYDCCPTSWLCACVQVLSVLVVLVCRHSQKKKRERKRKNLQQELNTVTGLSRNPSRRAGEWPDWNLVQQQKDDVWVPIQPERERSPYRQFSLYVEENLALQEDMKPSQPAKQKASQPAKRKPSNHKAQRQGSKKRDEDHRDDLYAKPHKQSSSYLQPPEDSTGPGWPWKPIGGLATRNKLSDSSLNSAAVATDPEEMMKLWHEDGWYQLRDLHTWSRWWHMPHSLLLNSTTIVTTVTHPYIILIINERYVTIKQGPLCQHFLVTWYWGCLYQHNTTIMYKYDDDGLTNSSTQTVLGSQKLQVHTWFYSKPLNGSWKL